MIPLNIRLVAYLLPWLFSQLSQVLLKRLLGCATNAFESAVRAYIVYSFFLYAVAAAKGYAMKN